MTTHLVQYHRTDKTLAALAHAKALEAHNAQLARKLVQLRARTPQTQGL